MKATRHHGHDHAEKPQVSRRYGQSNEGNHGWRARCSCFATSMRHSGRTNPNDRASASAGFTLVELMITVAIIGVLALLATVGYARWARTAKTAEATAMLGAIKSSEESWRAEHLNYLNVTGNLVTYFPESVPSDAKVAWNTTTCASTGCKNFKLLNVQADSAVYYRYAVQAGPADGAPVTLDGKTFSTGAYDPWFVAKAHGDLDGNGITSSFWTSSFNTTIVSERPGE